MLGVAKYYFFLKKVFSRNLGSKEEYVNIQPILTLDIVDNVRRDFNTFS